MENDFMMLIKFTDCLVILCMLSLLGILFYKYKRSLLLDQYKTFKYKQDIKKYENEYLNCYVGEIRMTRNELKSKLKEFYNLLKERTPSLEQEFKEDAMIKFQMLKEITPKFEEIDKMFKLNLNADEIISINGNNANTRPIAIFIKNLNDLLWCTNHKKIMSIWRQIFSDKIEFPDLWIILKGYDQEMREIHDLVADLRADLARDFDEIFYKTS